MKSRKQKSITQYKSKKHVVLAVLATCAVVLIAFMSQLGVNAAYEPYPETIPDELPPPGNFEAYVHYDRCHETRDNPYYDPPRVQLRWTNYTNYRLHSLPLSESRDYTYFQIFRDGESISIEKFNGGEGKFYDGYENELTRGREYTYQVKVIMSKDGKSVGATTPEQTVYVGKEDPPCFKMQAEYDGVTDVDATTGEVEKGTDIRLSWGSKGNGATVEVCEASGSWSGSKSGSGSAVVNVGNSLGKKEYILKCEDTDEGFETGGRKVFTVVEESNQKPEGEIVPDTGSLDLNGDGVDDNKQQNVGSTYNSYTNSYSVVESNSACAVNDDTGIISPANLIGSSDEGVRYPFGLMSFSLQCGDAGASTRVTQYYYTDTEFPSSDLNVSKYNSATKEYSYIEGASVAKTAINGFNAYKVVYSITDGGPLDEDGEANGVIVDPAGISVADNQTATNTTNDQGSTCSDGREGIPVGVGVEGAIDTNGDGKADCIPQTDEDGQTRNPIFTYLKGIISFLVVGTGIIITISIVVASIQFMSSRGNPQALAASKARLLNAVVALVLFILTASLLNFLVPGGLV